MKKPKLPDVLDHKLKVVFCGTAAGDTSANLRTYYADPRNRFWNVLYETGLTPQKFKAHEYENLLQLRIGLTDLAKYVSGTDNMLKDTDYDVDGLIESVYKFSPRVLALNGKPATAAILRQPKKKIVFGLQSQQLNDTLIFALPSTSGSNRHWDTKHHFQYWRELARYLNESSG